MGCVFFWWCHARVFVAAAEWSRGANKQNILSSAVIFHRTGVCVFASDEGLFRHFLRVAFKHSKRDSCGCGGVLFKATTTMIKSSWTIRVVTTKTTIVVTVVTVVVVIGMRSSSKSILFLVMTTTTIGGMMMKG